MHIMTSIATETSTTSPLSSTERDRQSLLSLLQASEGLDWSTSHTGWDASDTTSSVCDWEGISCRVALDGEKYYITGIKLPNTGLSGTLPPQLGQLEHLQELNLRGNLIRGSIPVEITQLKELQTVDLTECQLGGTLPQHWTSDKLEKLLLGQNGIGGKFFHDVTSPHIYSIVEINLEQNQLEGTLSGETIQAMGKLETLSLSQNNLSGLLPGREIGSLSSLKYLYLDSNHLVGSLSSSIAQQGKANLEEFWLQDNAFSGTVPASFVRLDRLHDFFIDGNKFTGLPEEICGPKINSDFFEVETANGGSSSSGQEKTYCDSIACPAGSISLEGMHPCTKCAGTPETARMKNPYLGQKGITCRDWSQRDILNMFYEGATKNGPWTKDGNGMHDWQNDEMNMCNFTGITCDGHGNVVKIGLSNRGLSGTISESIGFLEFLEELDVSDNDLTGFLPSDLRWTDLTKLDISGNRIRGVVPPLLCLMEDLNGNGNNNVFHCDRLACPSGSYNSQGRYFGGGNEEKCMPCYDETPFIGQKSCTHKNNPHSIFGQIMDGSQVVIESTKGLSTKLGFAILFLTSSVLFCCCVLRRSRQWYQKEMNCIGQRAILNHTNGTPEHKYQDDESSSGGSSSSSSSSGDSSVAERNLEMHVRNEYGYSDQYDQYNDNIVSTYSPKSFEDTNRQYNNYPSSASVSSSRSAPLQATGFIRDQKGFIGKKSPFKKVVQDHVPRARDAIKTSVQTVSNGVRNHRRRNSGPAYATLEVDQYSTIDFGSTLDLDMMGGDAQSDSGSTDSSNINRKTGSGGPRQYSDLLDVPTFE
ncbi:hypothetical protein ACHAXN_001893 [Cyclotella atomus]